MSIKSVPSKAYSRQLPLKVMLLLSSKNTSGRSSCQVHRDGSRHQLTRQRQRTTACFNLQNKTICGVLFYIQSMVSAKPLVLVLFRTCYTQTVFRPYKPPHSITTHTNVISDMVQLAPGPADPFHAVLAVGRWLALSPSSGVWPSLSLDDKLILSHLCAAIITENWTYA